MGNPLKLDKKMKERIFLLAQEGKTNKEIAFFIGVSDRTLYSWYTRDPELRTAMNDAKALADEVVVNALFEKAVGYEHKETKVFFHSETMQTVEHDVVKHYPPDTAAAIFWLNNRDPEKWASKQKVEHSGKVDGLSDQDLDAKIKALTEKTQISESE